MSKWTHLDERGAARMTDVGDKPVTPRRASASACVKMRDDVVRAIREQRVAKGDVLAVARVAGIMAAKRTSELIPLCHPLRLDAVSVDFALGQGTIDVVSTVATRERTGVEMEALTAASVAALTIYDMCKAVDRAIRIENVVLLSKEGGESGPSPGAARSEDA